MGRFEITCRRFAVLSGIHQEADDYTRCVHPRAGALQRKGALALLAEPAGDHPSLAVEACRLAQEAIFESFYGDLSVSMTSSLLNALEAANSALLQHNYGHESAGGSQSGGVAVQAGGVRTKRARVGLTAALMRPDGTGLYLAQLAPTQAFIMHNGLLSALPELPGWHTQVSGLVPVPPEVGEQPDSEPGASDEPRFPSLTSAPLGSGPSVDVDLIYRRVEAGDIVLLVSSSLARYLDRPTCERIFAYGDVDSILGALYAIATEMGVAEAHACVLELGVESASGVESNYTPTESSYLHAPSPSAQEVTSNGGSRIRPNGPLTRVPDIRAALQGSREWIVRRRRDAAPTENEQDEPPSPDEAAELQADDAEPQAGQAAAHLTEALLHRSLEIPPYRADWQKELAEMPDETPFDGWEDSPPALEEPWFLKSERQRPTLDRSQLSQAAPTQSGGQERRFVYDPAKKLLPPIPSFLDADFEEELDPAPEVSLQAHNPSENPRRLPTLHNVRISGSGIVKWLGRTLAGLLPERIKGSRARAGAGSQRTWTLRLGLAVGLVVVIGILAFSVLSISTSQKRGIVTGYLEQAKQEDLLANQPGIDTVRRRQHLDLALAKAKEAYIADPTSTESERLIARIQSDLDKLDGITRLAQVNLLFDLDQVGTLSPGQPQSNDAQGGPTPVAAGNVGGSENQGKGEAYDIAVQSNEAYVLDKEGGKVYRCRIATKDCMVTLSRGDTVAGQQVGVLVGMAMRVGSLLVVDSNLVVYVYSADASTWQAQPLGDAAALEKPKDVATYDGNLYLLGAKPGQISKYIAGRYGESPDDWLKDQPSLEQMQAPISLAIDGAIFVLLADGRILAMQGGKVTATLAPAGEGQPPTSLFTSTDTRDLYLLRAADGTIIRLGKEGQVVSMYKAPVGEEALAILSGMAVDEGAGKLYLVAGKRIYEASLPGKTAQPSGEAQSVQGEPAQQPAARPTAAP